MRIVCLGGTLALLSAAATVRKKHPHAQITLINPDPKPLATHARRTLSERHTVEARLDLPRAAASLGARFIQSTVVRIDRTDRTVILPQETVHYDALIIDLPHEPSAAHEQDTLAHAHYIRSEESIAALKRHIEEELARARAQGHEQHRTFLVAGLGREGMETASELNARVHARAHDYTLFPYELKTIAVKVDRDEHDTFSERVASKLQSELEKLGIHVEMPSSYRFHREAAHIDGRVIPTNTVVWTGSPRGNHLFSSAGLALDEHGFVHVDQALRTSDPLIFATGNSIRHVAGARLPTHRSAAELIAEGQIAAHNALNLTQGKRGLILPPPRGTRTVSLGPKHAVSWHGPFVFTGSLPHTLHHGKEGRAAERILRELRAEVTQ